MVTGPYISIDVKSAPFEQGLLVQLAGIVQGRGKVKTLYIKQSLSSTQWPLSPAAPLTLFSVRNKEWAPSVSHAQLRCTSPSLLTKLHLLGSHHSLAHVDRHGFQTTNKVLVLPSDFLTKLGLASSLFQLSIIPLAHSSLAPPTLTPHHCPTETLAILLPSPAQPPLLSSFEKTPAVPPSKPPSPGFYLNETLVPWVGWFILAGV